MLTVTKEFRFEAAHSLPHLPTIHKCHRLHGHSYGVVIHCEGELLPEYAWIVDYAEITAAMQPLLEQLDHHNLNEVFRMTTAENLALWIAAKLEVVLPSLSAVEVRETPTTNVIYRLPRNGKPFRNLTL